MFGAAVLTLPDGGVAAWLPLLARRRTDRHATTRHGTRNPVGPEARSFIWDPSGEDCRTQATHGGPWAGGPGRARKGAARASPNPLSSGNICRPWTQRLRQRRFRGRMAWSGPDVS